MLLFSFLPCWIDQSCVKQKMLYPTSPSDISRLLLPKVDVLSQVTSHKQDEKRRDHAIQFIYTYLVLFKFLLIYSHKTENRTETMRQNIPVLLQY